MGQEEMEDLKIRFRRAFNLSVLSVGMTKDHRGFSQLVLQLDAEPTMEQFDRFPQHYGYLPLRCVFTPPETAPGSPAA